MPTTSLPPASVYDYLLPQCYLPTVTLCGNYCVDALESTLSSCLNYIETLDPADQLDCVNNIAQVFTTPIAAKLYLFSLFQVHAACDHISESLCSTPVVSRFTKLIALDYPDQPPIDIPTNDTIS